MIGTFRSFVESAIPSEIRAFRLGDKDPLRRRVWSYLFSENINKAIENGVLYSEKNYPFKDIQKNSHALNPDILKTYEPFGLSYVTRESAYVINKTAFIEPVYGWIICDPVHLVDNCLIDSTDAPRPSLMNYVEARLLQSTEIIKEHTLISLRDRGEQNYYHTLIDLIGGRLRIAEQCNLNPNIPLLVGKSLYRKSFFQDILRKSELCERNLIIQDDSFIRCEKVYFFETNRTNKKSLEFLIDFLRIPDSNRKSNRRVFLTRSPQAGRNINNIIEIEEVCRKFNFEIVDTAQMGLDEQIKLFSEARYVIGIHGAGLTNIIFRKNAMLSLLEIFPPLSYYGQALVPPPRYLWMACALEFEYDAILGTENLENHTSFNHHNSFKVDANLLSDKIESMLN